MSAFEGEENAAELIFDSDFTRDSQLLFNDEVFLLLSAHAALLRTNP